MKKTIFECIALVIMSILIASCDETQTSLMVDGVRYQILSDSTAEVVNDSSYNKVRTINIPPVIQIKGKEYKVTSIGDAAFAGCEELSDINIPATVVHIGSFSFEGCSKLKNIIIPPNVTIIEKRTFVWCHSLENITIPDNVISIESRAFYACYSLSSVTMSKNITNIGTDAFQSCTELSSINLPSCISCIGEKAFAFCPKLNITIDISRDKVRIGKDAFDDCYSVKFKEDETSIADMEVDTVDGNSSNSKFNTISDSTIEELSNDSNSYQYYQTIDDNDKDSIYSVENSNV